MLKIIFNFKFLKEDEKETDSLNFLNEIKPEKICFLQDLNHKEEEMLLRAFCKKQNRFCSRSIMPIKFMHCLKMFLLSQTYLKIAIRLLLALIWRYYLLSYLDQIFKYKYRNTSPQHFSKIIMLPLHSAEQLKKQLN